MKVKGHTDLQVEPTRVPMRKGSKEERSENMGEGRVPERHRKEGRSLGHSVQQKEGGQHHLGLTEINSHLQHWCAKLGER